MNAIQVPENRRLVYLDAARGIASLRVITAHFLMGVFGPAPDSFRHAFPWQIFWYGEADMLFFFVHSGFVLAYAYDNRRWVFGGRFYAGFLVERIFRIFPMFLFVLVLSFWAARLTPVYPFSDNGWVAGQWSQYPRAADLLSQALLVVRIPDYLLDRLLSQDWTLTVELLAGATVPALLVAGKKSGWWFLGLLIVFGIVNLFTPYILEFGIGVALYHNWEKVVQGWKEANLWKRAIFILLTILLYNCLFTFPTLFTGGIVFLSQSVDQLIVAMGCTGLFICLLSSPVLQRRLSARLFVGIGKSCYSLYCWHMLFILTAWRLYPNYFSALRQQPWWHILGVFLLFLVVIIGLSHLTYHLIERPFNELGKKITASFVPRLR